MKKKIYGYVKDNTFEFLNEAKHELREINYDNASKSKIIELALIELKNNNDILSIGTKLTKEKLV